jgi:hypothetical protein
MYVNYEYYESLYGGNTLAETDFHRISWEAEREVDKATSGVDGVKKLKVAFPVDEYDAEVVKRCICELVNFIYRLEKAQNAMNNDGGIVISKSAGNESITYENTDSDISSALKSAKGREKAIYSFIVSKLSGVSDANGVNLLFAGRYPY